MKPDFKAVYEAIFWTSIGSPYASRPASFILMWGLPLASICYSIYSRDMQYFGMGILGFGFAALLTIPLLRYCLELRRNRLAEYSDAIREIGTHAEIANIYLFERPRNWVKTDMDNVKQLLRVKKLLGYQHRIKYLESSKALLIKTWMGSEPEWDGLWYVS